MRAILTELKAEILIELQYWMVIFEQVDLPLLKIIENLFVEITRE